MKISGNYLVEGIKNKPMMFMQIEDTTDIH